MKQKKKEFLIRILNWLITSPSLGRRVRGPCECIVVRLGCIILIDLDSYSARPHCNCCSTRFKQKKVLCGQLLLVKLVALQPRVQTEFFSVRFIFALYTSIQQPFGKKRVQTEFEHWKLSRGKSFRVYAVLFALVRVHFSCQMHFIHFFIWAQKNLRLWGLRVRERKLI